jgi:quinol monooxygenase YgiN
MLSITAIVRAKKGSEETLRRAFHEVVRYVRKNEPRTLAYYVSQDTENPCVFTTYERFADRAAMEAHNGSAAVAAFFAVAKPLLDGDVALVVGAEVASKGGEGREEETAMVIPAEQLNAANDE